LEDKSHLRILNYQSLALLLLAVPVIFATARWVAAADEPSRITADGTLATEGYDGQEIPVGFKVERYAQLWQHNPFTVETAVAPPVQASIFDKLFLASWMVDDGKEVIFVQNSETNEVQSITTEPNQNNLRLVAIHLDPDPRLVQAVLSNGTEQGTAKFRFDSEPKLAQTLPAAGQAPNNGLTGQVPKAAEFASRRPTGPQTNLPATQASGVPAASPVSLSAPHNNYYPGVQRVRSEGAQMQRPQSPGKHVMPTSTPPGQ
jgi:hypothetical protein